MRVLLISSVVPRPATGGELLLLRHLTRLRENHNTEIFIITFGHTATGEDSLFSWINLEQPAFLERLRRSRFAKWAQYWMLLREVTSVRALSRLAGRCRPDIILTVAHGELFYFAVKIATALKLPLITIYHDWWPDSAKAHRLVRKLWQKRFIRLAEKSTCNLCVCPGMAEMLGKYANGEVKAEILYPISSKKRTLPGYQGFQQEPPAILQVAYAGNLFETYGEMIRDLADLVAGEESIEFRFIGPRPHWTANEFDRMQGFYCGYLLSDESMAFLCEQDVFLVTMSFKKNEKRRAMTSFPSKLVEYCQLGKAIVIWGPEYCSAVQWARQTGVAVCVTEDKTEKVLEVLKDIQSRAQLSVLGGKAAVFARESFSSFALQQKFETVLTTFAGKAKP